MTFSLLIGLSKATLVSSLGFAIAYPLLQNSSSKAKNPKTQKEIKKQSKEETEPIEFKKCEVFLTSVDGIHTVVSCQETNSTKNWYLFNSNNNTLTGIKGLTSSYSPKTELGSSIDDWREREWRGFQGWDTKKHRGNNPTEGSFKIAYNQGSFKFPFFKYFKDICSAVNTYIHSGNKMVFSCDPLDFPSSKFTDRLLIQEYKQAFKSNSEPRCLEGRKNSWKVIPCEQAKQN